VHVGAPPPAPKRPQVDIRTAALGPSSASISGPPKGPAQMLTISLEGDEDWGPGLAGGVEWRVQCVPEDVRAGEGGRADGWGAFEGERASYFGFERKQKRARFEMPLDELKMGPDSLQSGVAYLWRVAARHPTFGEGAFSASTRVYFEQDVTDDVPEGAPPLWRTVVDGEVYDRRLVRTSDTVNTQIYHAVSLGGKTRPPDLVSAGSDGVKAVQLASDGGRCLLKEMAFEDAERPPEELAKLLYLVGDTEIVGGVLDLTPLRKGIGLSGAAWFHRPLGVLPGGFETEFTFKIAPNVNATPAEGDSRVRGSDGFAFVLQLDRQQVHSSSSDEIITTDPRSAIGASGIQLGYGGLTSCLAVQFATSPSCARKELKPSKGVSGETTGDGKAFLCSLIHDPKYNSDGKLNTKASQTSHFYVDAKNQGYECIDPVSKKRFVAPELPKARKPKEEVIQLSHHLDRVSVQCPGVHPTQRVTTGPEACMGTAEAKDLDDGELHTARIILERNRFQAPAIAKTAEQKATLEAAGALAQGSPSHRLLVYVDDMQHARINLELDVEDVFGDTLHETGGKMIAGFTAGTGRANASHIITSWKYFEVAETKENEEQSGVGSFFSNLFGL